MEFVTFVITSSKRYSYKESSNISMNILGDFLSSDVRCGGVESFRQWAFNDWENHTGGNLTYLEKRDGNIILGDLYSEEEPPSELIMTYEQYVQVLNDWQEKVCNREPKEVTIKYENDQYVFEIKD